jgi:hypothetical protein
MKYILTLLLTFSIQAQDLFVFAGQSNMAGYGQVKDLKMSDLDNTNIYGWDWSEDRWVHNPSPINNPDVFHAERLDGILIHANRESWGCELSALRILRDKTKKPVYFIKYAVGGSSLDEWNNIYLDRLNTEINLTSKSPKAWFWMQGETDAINLDTANSYKESLGVFATNTGTKFIAGMISKRWPYASTVRNALYELNREQVISIISTDSFNVYQGPDSHPDGLNTAHYKSDSLRKMGTQFALSFLYCSSVSSYPEIIGDFNGDGNTDFMMIKPVGHEKHFTIFTMNNFSIQKQHRLKWKGKDFYRIHETYDFVGVTDPDNDGDDDISHTSGESMHIWRLEFPNITHSKWIKE